jgi:hypothetical protein
MNRLKMFVVCGGGAVALSACASNGFVSSWQAPDAAPLQVSGSKVAAVAMMRNESSRRAAEDALARELTARGAMGVPLYTILPDASPDNEAAVRAALEQQGFAGVVSMRPVDKETEVVSTPAPYAGPHYGGFWGGYYGYGWGAAWGTSADIRTNTIVSVETLVYSLRQNKLVWGGESKTTNPSSVDRLVQDTAEKAAKELQRRGLIPG